MTDEELLKHLPAFPPHKTDGTRLPEKELSDMIEKIRVEPK